MADIFAYQKFQYGYILEALGMENVGVPILWPFGVFYDCLVYFVLILYILCSFYIFCAHLECYTSFGMLNYEKSGIPWLIGFDFFDQHFALINFCRRHRGFSRL
jgi:hypothetical protein